MMQDPIRVDDVEAIVGKAEPLSIFHLEGALEPERAEMASGCLDRGPGQVDARISGAAGGEHRAVGAVAATYLENLPASAFGERNQQRDMPLRLVAEASILFVEVALIAEVLDEMRSASF